MSFLGLAHFDFTRKNLLQRFLSKPGEGPSKEQRENGFFKISLYGYQAKEDSPQLKLVIKGDKDPGYGSTSMMLSEAALSLALGEGNNDLYKDQFGVITPSLAFGMNLKERLEKNGMVR